MIFHTTKIKKVFLTIFFLILGYFILFNIFTFLSILPIKYMDFNKNGFVSINEAFRAIDARKRILIVDGKECVEYFDLKDGLPIVLECDIELIDK